jgi:prolyl-tRNA editing enzyme YbaK/EbsC (Cys-tRNA(Pro) deacylase)
MGHGRLWGMVGTLTWHPATARPDLLAEPVVAALDDLTRVGGQAAPHAEQVQVAEIDPELADTAAFCATYGVGLDMSANCVVVTAKRGGRRELAACVVLATTRADVNGVVRRHLDARKVSFAAMDEAVEASGMAFGGITAIGLPPEWPLLVDVAVARSAEVVVGSGLRRSKLLVPGVLLAELPGAEVLGDLGRPPEGAG